MIHCRREFLSGIVQANGFGALVSLGNNEGGVTSSSFPLGIEIIDHRLRSWPCRSSRFASARTLLPSGETIGELANLASGWMATGVPPMRETVKRWYQPWSNRSSKMVDPSGV